MRPIPSDDFAHIILDENSNISLEGRVYLVVPLLTVDEFLAKEKFLMDAKSSKRAIDHDFIIFACKIKGVVGFYRWASANL